MICQEGDQRCTETICSLLFLAHVDSYDRASSPCFPLKLKVHAGLKIFTGKFDDQPVDFVGVPGVPIILI